ncbi:hypothetical protein F5Y14DRAFT_448492 [Nemania sp. NC0429]|nr:hypothetical protein F5Y14DRAFT_448492 [Nemania sp. NC0429]
MAKEFVSSLDFNRDAIVAGPVPVEPFVPSSANLFPKMTRCINDAAWELWEFEGFSANGEATVGVSFYRDARGIEERGFHADVNAIWPDGIKWSETLYFTESTIAAEGDSPHDGHVHGVWKSMDGEGRTIRGISFNIEADHSSATVHFSVPNKVTGVIELRSSGADKESRLPGTEKEALLCPSVYYMFPMGPVTAKVDLTFTAVDDDWERRLCIHPSDGGEGGMVRGWSSRAWPQFMDDAYYVVARVGPYKLQLIRIVGSAGAGRRSSAVARLYRGDELLCAANQSIPDEPQEAETTPKLGGQDIVLIEKVPRGNDEQTGLAGAFRDKNIGYAIEFTSAQQKRWRFDARHKRALWSEPTSAPGPECTGKSGWIEAVSGGAEGEMFEGTGVGGQLQIPVQQ